MSERKIIVPQGMLKAAYVKVGPDDKLLCCLVLEAALLWLSENPIVPDEELAIRLITCHGIHTDADAFAEWQRRMFLAPEPKIPEEVRDLLWKNGVIKPADESVEECDRRIIEAFRRGKEASCPKR